MSTALDTAIYNRLAGVETLTADGLAAQQGIAAILDTDPDTTKPAVINANMSKVEPIGNRCITFQEMGGRADTRFAQQSGRVLHGIYAIEHWSIDEDNTIISNLEEYTQQLLDTARGLVGAPMMVLSSGKLFNSVVFVAMQRYYSEKYNRWSGLVQYQFDECRY